MPHTSFASTDSPTFTAMTMTGGIKPQILA